MDGLCRNTFRSCTLRSADDETGIGVISRLAQDDIIAAVPRTPNIAYQIPQFPQQFPTQIIQYL